MKLFIHRSKSKNPFYNLALEEYFLSYETKKIQNAYLFFYENINSIILGKTLNMTDEVYDHKKLPFVIRRASGGGSVVHGKGNINYGLLVSLEQYPQLLNISNSYKIILQQIGNAAYKNLPVSIRGISDICLQIGNENRKVSGNSQVRKKKWLLHHGTLLYSSSILSEINSYLRPPPRQPEYRNGKSHKDFMAKKVPILDKSKIIREIIKIVSNEFNLIPSMMKYDPVQTHARSKFTEQFIKDRWLNKLSK